MFLMVEQVRIILLRERVMILLLRGDGGANLADADRIKDFTDGTDIIGLAEA